MKNLYPTLIISMHGCNFRFIILRFYHQEETKNLNFFLPFLINFLLFSSHFPCFPSWYCAFMVEDMAAARLAMDLALSKDFDENGAVAMETD